MESIKFSRQWIKLHGQVRATLLHVLVVDSSDLGEGFRTIDTMYTDFSRNKGVMLDQSILKMGKTLLFVFLGDKFIPFCTTRSFTDERYNHYRDRIGLTFELETPCE